METVYEIIRGIVAVLCFFCILFSIKEGRSRWNRMGMGWFVSGIVLFFFATLIDITDNFPQIIWLHDSFYIQPFLEDILGYLAGFVLLCIGFLRQKTAMEKAWASEKKISDALRREQNLRAKLSNTTSLYMKIFENTGTAVVLIEDDETIKMVNSGFTELTGYLPDEVQGRPAGTYVPENELERLRKFHKLRLLDPQKAPHSYRFTIRAKNDELKSVFATVDRIPEMNLTVMSLIDLTQLNAAIAALKESQERYRLHFENVRDIIYILDHDYKIIDVSPSVELTIGYRRDELIGRPFYELNLMSEKDLDKAFHNIQHVLAGGHIDGVRYRFIDKNGNERIGEVSGSPYFKDGKIVGVISVARDVTFQHKLEEENNRLATAVKYAADGILLCSPDWQITYANPAACKITGYDEKDLLGKHFRSIMGDALTTSWYEMLKAGIMNGSVWNRKIRTSRADGKDIVINMTVSQVQDEGGNLLFSVCILHDVTKEENLHLQLVRAQKLEAIASLAAGIAHDFNNILSVISGNAELVSFKAAGMPELKRHSDTILSAVSRGKSLVSQILSFAKDYPTIPKPIDLAPIISETEKFLRSSLVKNIKIHTQVQEDIPLVNADPISIHQVLMNLYTNAAHAMSQGGGVLSIMLDAVDIEEGTNLKNARESTLPDLSPGRYVRIAVEDTGCGISPGDINRIFDPYFSTKGHGYGTGLGLSTVYGIVRKLKGDITVESKPGKGTRFTVYIPALPENEKSEPISEEKERIPRGSGEKILFIEDDPTLMDAASNLLHHLGYEVFVYFDPLTALEVFTSNPEKFDLVITDISFPRISGERLVKEIKSICPDIPIIMFSGFSEPVDSNKARILGIHTYLQKPIILNELAQALQTAIGKKKKDEKLG